MLKDDYHITGRTGKQCRERWHNHLDPSIKKSPINQEEEIIIFDAHKVYGNKWADIAKLLEGRSDNCIKNYYYSTLRKHIRRINKSLKQCQVAKQLNLKVKTLTADILFPLVKDGKISYSQVKNIDPKKFEDLEHTMRMIFNHEDG
jgi:myb proto-oncogene protein